MTKRLFFICVLIGLIPCFLVRFLYGFDGAFGQDPYEYLRYTDALKNWMVNGTHPGDYFWPIGNYDTRRNPYLVENPGW